MTLNKIMLIYSGLQNESYADFESRMVGIAGEMAKNTEVLKVKVVLTREAPPVISIIPFKKEKAAVLSMYKETDAPVDFDHGEGFRGGYTVEEALPVSYERSRPEGPLTPGICLLTLFKKKKDIAYDLFIDRWHNGHTPLSLRIHPLWHYSRNVVKSKLIDMSEDWDGLVDEHFRERSDLLSPFRFFGNPLVILPRMLKVYFDVKSFLDYESIETYLTREIMVESKA